MMDIVGRRPFSPRVNIAAAPWKCSRIFAGALDLPIFTVGTGLYLRALLEGLADAPERSDPLRARLNAMQARRGARILHALLRRLDPAASARISANDRQKLVRALEVCLLAGKPLTELHRAGRERLAGLCRSEVGLNPPREALYGRIERRVCHARARLAQEVAALIASALPKAKPFEFIGYRELALRRRGQPLPKRPSNRPGHAPLRQTAAHLVSQGAGTHGSQALATRRRRSQRFWSMWKSLELFADGPIGRARRGIIGLGGNVQHNLGGLISSPSRFSYPFIAWRLSSYENDSTNRHPGTSASGRARIEACAACSRHGSDEIARESLEELAELARSAGAVVAGSVLQMREAIDPASVVGRGKLDEIRAEATARKAPLVIFDRNLTPVQQRNLERGADCRVIDRTQLILDIFARHARSREGQLQVELAQLNYFLPRLAGAGPELSRLGGGIGTRGPGEQKLETDRRRIRERVRASAKPSNRCGGSAPCAAAPASSAARHRRAGGLHQRRQIHAV